MFIAIEGPNGVGKSAVCHALAGVLRNGCGEGEVLLTGEPSSSPLGQAIRILEDELKGAALGLACAADRLHHVDHEISPALARGAMVITDRYVPSSLVLQRIDGLDVASIWRMNETARAPDLTVYLEDAPDLISARLRSRQEPSRLETASTPELELGLYREARAFLQRADWRQIVVQQAGRPPDDVAGDIAAALRA